MQLDDNVILLSQCKDSVRRIFLTRNYEDENCDFLREITKVRTAGNHNTLDDHIVSTAVTQDREQLDCVYQLSIELYGEIKVDACYEKHSL